jgi:hypothetical protein
MSGPDGFCGICLAKYGRVDASGLCKQHGKPVRGVWKDETEPHLALLDDEERSHSSLCECRIERKSPGHGKEIHVFLCQAHKDAMATVERVGAILSDDHRALEGETLIKRAEYLERLEQLVGRAEEHLEALDLNVKENDDGNKDIDDLVEAAVNKFTENEDFEDDAELCGILLEACGMTAADWGCGKDPWYRAKFNPVTFLVERLRELAPQRLAEPLTFVERQAQKVASFDERLRATGVGPSSLDVEFQARPDFLGELRAKVDKLEAEVAALQVLVLAPKRKRKGATE